MKFLQQFKTAAGNAWQKTKEACANLVEKGKEVALKVIAPLGFGAAAGSASAQNQTPIEQAQGLLTTATTTFGNVVTFAMLVTGFGLIMWVVLKIRKTAK